MTLRDDRQRLDLLETAADTLTLVATLAPVILPDIHAARGQRHQERATHPRLLPDVRDPDYDGSTDKGETDVEPSGPAIRYADPTGDAAGTHDQASLDLHEIDRIVVTLSRGADRLVGILRRHQTARTPDAISDLRKLADGELDTDEWCRSHLRVHVLEPITLRRDRNGGAKPYYAGVCRWCGEMAADLKAQHPKRFGAHTMPPVELVQIHASGRKVTERDVLALVGPQHHPRTERRRGKGEDRKRRSA